MEWLRMRGRSTSGKSQGFMVLLAGLLVSLFAGILVTSAPALAADATWEGSRLEYQGTTFEPINDSALIEDLSLEGSARAYGAPVRSGGSSEFRVISFPAGSNMSSATSAEYMVYDFVPPDDYSLVSTATITAEAAGDNYGGLEQGNSCTISGIGYLVCPIANHLASGMDWIYGVLTQFLSAQPLNISDNTSGLYQAWRIMLTIANAAFIVVFMVIIYSHITSMGVSNYGIKKLLPRLIVAAVLVNVSYYVCAIAIDLSNIIGQSIQDMFISIRNTMTTVGSAGGEEIPTWETITAIVLSSGAAAAGAGTFLITYGGSSGAASIMLLPLLLGLLITIIVVLLVLAARQALIVILTIISPLAFVCYLLPGTEKWFDKWKDLFITMLIFFPAFSAVFGGSQLAGAAIIQNADSIVMLILGLGVQVAPLALAPLILKLSGGLLNRFAGVVNNPAKGLLDKTRNFAKEQSQYVANRRSLGNDNLKKRNFIRNAGRWANHTKRKRDERVENYQKMADASYEASKGHAEMDKMRREIEQTKQLTDKQLDIDWNVQLKDGGEAMEKDLKLRILTDKSELTKLHLDNRYEEFKAGHRPAGSPPPIGEDDPIQQLINDSRDTTQHLAAQGLRKNNAQRVLNKQLAENMLASEQLQVEAGGIYEFGKDAAIASAISTMRSDYAKSVEEGAQIVKHFELSAEQRQAHAMGSEEFTVTKEDGTSYTFRNNGVFTREFAIEEQMAVGTVSQVSEILSASGGDLAEFRSTISAALAKSGVKSKAPFLGGKLINDVAKGDIASTEDLQSYVIEWIQGGKFKPSDVSIIDKEGLDLVIQSIGAPGSEARGEIGDNRLKGLRAKIDEVFRNPELHANIADNALGRFKALRESLPVPDPDDD